MLVRLRAERHFGGINVQLGHVHAGPASHRLLVCAARHEKRQTMHATGISKLSTGRRTEITRGIKRRL